MSTISSLISQISQISGTNDKIDFLATNSVGNRLSDIFYHAYSPRFVYGLKKVEPVEMSCGAFDDVATLDDNESVDKLILIMNSLHNRELTGNAARNVVNDFLSKFETEDQITICNIIKRDLRCGMNVSNINKSIKNLIELAPPYQRCSLMKDGKFDEFEIDGGFYSQVKADGMFINLHLSSATKTTKMLTRNGNEFPIHKFTDFYGKIQESFERGLNYDSWYAGEVVLKRNGKLLDRKTSNGIANSITKGGEIPSDIEIVYFVWDVIPSKFFLNKGKYHIVYDERFKVLQDDVIHLDMEECFKVIETKLVYSYEEAYEHYKQCRSKGLEGTVIKCSKAPWLDGTSKYQIKMKAEVEIDLVIRGMNPGNGKHQSTFGSLIMESACGGLVCNVSGFSDDERKEIFDNFETDYKNTIGTVRSNEMIQSRNRDTYSLFLPRWIQHRPDKSVADDNERIKAIFESVL